MVGVKISGPVKVSDLGRVVAAELGISQREGRKAVRIVADIITKAVAEGHDVTISNFGTFRKEQRAAFTARDPRNGSKIATPAQDVCRFRPSPSLKEHVRGF